MTGLLGFQNLPPVACLLILSKQFYKLQKQAFKYMHLWGSFSFKEPTVLSLHQRGFLLKPEDGEMHSQKVSSGSNIAIVLMNPLQLWLSAQNLHRIKSVNHLAQRGRGSQVPTLDKELLTSSGYRKRESYFFFRGWPHTMNI